jgi:chromosome segregation ATPase
MFDGNDASKCDKIQISLTHSANKSTDNLITITVYISTGRIQIQGKPLKSWGNIEFDIFMNMTNSADELKQQNSIEKLDQFLDEAIRESENIKQERNKSRKSQTSEKVVSPNTPVQTATQSEANTPCERSFSMIKTQAATLESDMVNFKQEILKSLEDVMETLEQKDNQIALLNDKISQAHSNDIVRKQTISDLSLKQYEQQEEINKLKHTIKNQQQQIQSLKLKFNTLPHHNVPSSSELHIQIQDEDENSEPGGYPDHPSSNEARPVTTN